MLKINIPDSPSSTTKVSLGGITYRFNFTYIGTTRSYYVVVRDMDGNVVIPSSKLVEGVDLVRKYKHFGFDHGTLVVAKVRETESKPGRNNIGNNKPYLLVYFSNDEINVNE